MKNRKRFIYKSAIELAGMIRQGQASSLEIVSEHILHIKEHNHQFNAMVLLMEEEARRVASECDAEIRQNRSRGPLHGVPITIKECFWIRGTHSTNNSAFLRNFIAPEDAIVVERVRKAGAVILGKTNVPRNLLDYQVNGDIFPEGKNPYNPDYSPGGSTGGGASSVAAGFSPLELGNDFGGSIRVPANFCGLFGLKPTDRTVPVHGNIALRKNSKSFLVHMAQAGPLARNLDDLELLWRVIVGPDSRESTVSRIEWQESQKGQLSDFKIAWVDGWPGYPVSKETSKILQGLVNDFVRQGGGATRLSDKTSLHENSLRVYMSLFPYVIAQGFPWLIRQVMRLQLNNSLLKGSGQFSGEIRRAFRLDFNTYAQTLQERDAMTNAWEEIFREFDFIVCPAGFGPAYPRCKIGSRLVYEETEMSYLNYVWPFTACFNASGHPALAFPLGPGSEGLPLGIQIVGPLWSEPRLIQFARLLRELTPGFVRPSMFESL